jgi:drug/metabolite transporter (DMT)-like permease
MSSTMNMKDWAALGFISFLWGGSFFFYKVLAGDVPPLLIAAIRVFLAGLLLWALIRATGQTLPRTVAAWTAFVVMGILNNVLPFILIAWSETQITSGLTAILNATTPIFTVLIASVAGAERFTLNRALGVLIGLAGVVVLVGPDAMRTFNLASIAQLCVLGASLSYACASTFWRLAVGSAVTPLTGATGQLLGAALVSTPLAAAAFIPSADSLLHFSAGLHLTLTAAAALLGITLLCTALPYPIFFNVLRKAGPTNALLVALLMPISALALGGMFLGERLNVTAYIGMGIIFMALAIIDGRVLAWLRRSFESRPTSTPEPAADQSRLS